MKKILSVTTALFMFTSCVNNHYFSLTYDKEISLDDLKNSLSDDDYNLSSNTYYYFFFNFLKINFI